MSLTSDVLKQPAEPRTVTFGAAVADVDYSVLRRLSAKDYESYFNRIFKLLTRDEDAEIWTQISAVDKSHLTWLAYALYLHAKNRNSLPDGFDHRSAVAGLIAWASQSATMPGAENDSFEREVLRASGWVSATVVKSLTVPPRDIAAKLAPIYNPPGEGGNSELGPLRVAVLRDELIPELESVVDEQVSYWLRPRGEKPEPEPIDRMKKFARFIQDYTALSMRPYADAWESGPYFDGFRYADRLRSTWELPAEHSNQINYLLNRAQVIGRDAERGELLVKANYDGSRSGDEQTLCELLEERLGSNSALRKKVMFTIKHTSAHTGGVGNISIQPVFPTAKWGRKGDWRWRLIRTLVHELLHRLAHPDFTAKAGTIRHGQIIREGFVELLTVDIYTKLWNDIKRKDRASLLLEGVEPDAVPHESFFKVGYGKAGTSAEEIRRQLRDDRVRAAFFLGATHLIGL